MNAPTAAVAAVADHQCEWSGGERWSDVATAGSSGRNGMTDLALYINTHRTFLCKCGFGVTVEYAPTAYTVIAGVRT